MIHYNVVKMRVVIPKGRVAEKNPDRFATIHGDEFRNEKGEPLSFTSKEVTKADAQNPETVIDIPNGILILPAGQRGRKPSVSATQEDIETLLNSVRETVVEAAAE